MGRDVEHTLPFSFTRIFEYCFPYFLSWGMSYEQFWNGEPSLVKYYLKARELKVQEDNTNAWLQGIYFTQALNSALSNVFAEKKSDRVQYFEKPIAVTKEQIEIERAKKEEEEFIKQKNSFLRLVGRINKEIEEKGGK